MRYAIAITVLALAITSSSFSITTSKRIAVTDLPVSIEKIEKILSQYLGQPTELKEGYLWKVFRYRVYAIELADELTLITVRRFHIQERKAPKLKRVANIWTRPIRRVTK